MKLSSANAIVDELLEAVVSDLPFKSGDRVALMINGLGGTPISELYILYGRAHEQLASRGISVGRNYVGEYCTSLDMAGCSLTLVKLDSEIECRFVFRFRSSAVSRTSGASVGVQRVVGRSVVGRTTLTSAEHLVYNRILTYRTEGTGTVPAPPFTNRRQT